MRIVEVTAHRPLWRASRQCRGPARAQARQVRGPRGAKPPSRGADALRRAEPLRPLRTVEPLPGVMRINLPRDLDLAH